MTTPDPDKGGRPAIGPKVPINFPNDLLRDINAAAEEAGMSRAAWIRRTVEKALPENYEGLLSAAQWDVLLFEALTGRSNAEDADFLADLREAVKERQVEDVTLTSQISESATAAGFTRIGLITRRLRVRGRLTTAYQVSELRRTYPTATDSEGNCSARRRMFASKERALIHYGDCLDNAGITLAEPDYETHPEES